MLVETPERDIKVIQQPQASVKLLLTFLYMLWPYRGDGTLTKVVISNRPPTACVTLCGHSYTYSSLFWTISYCLGGWIGRVHRENLPLWPFRAFHGLGHILLATFWPIWDVQLLVRVGTFCSLHPPSQAILRALISFKLIYVRQKTRDNAQNDVNGNLSKLHILCLLSE